jgi:hypothetical protein
MLLDEGTLIQGRPRGPFRPGDSIEADVTPEGHREINSRDEIDSPAQ